MTQKNLKPKLNFYRPYQTRRSAVEGAPSFLSSQFIATDRSYKCNSSHLIQKSTYEPSTVQSVILRDQVSNSGIHLQPFTREDPNLQYRKRRESELNRTDNKGLNLADIKIPSRPDYKVPSFLKPLQSFAPKLRETGSTQCQSPKSNMLKMKQTKVEQFKKLKPLGKGRFGQVFLVKHRETGFIGALKVINKSDLLCGTSEQNEKALKQLASQIKIQAVLNHPNLVKLYDYFSDEKNIYLFLQLACDGPLFDSLDESRCFTEESTSIVMREVASGVAHMHKHDMIHRDIKLENIVLCHGMAKICDFGWSVHCPTEFRNTICGTPLYLSPEILMGMQYNKKIDSWAIGTLAHELCTAENPFRIKTRDQLSKIITQDFQMKTGSAELKSFVTFILRKNPSKRPDAETILKHPFIEKFRDMETSDELCNVSMEGRGEQEGEGSQ